MRVDQQYLRAAVLDDIGDLVFLQLGADRDIDEPRAMRRPGDLVETRPRVHQQRDRVAMVQPHRPQHVRGLVRALVELPIGHHLAAARHDDGGFVGGFGGVDIGVHGCADSAGGG
jgi:predicted HD phosphohydrolase